MFQILTPISLPSLFLQDVLALDVKQLLVVADYQLLEAAEAADDTDGGGAANAAADVLKTRIPLLIRCLANDRHKTRAVVDYLIEKITDHEEEDAEEENKDNNEDGVPPSINNNRKDVVQELLLQVYMKLPNCLIHLTSDSAATSLGRLLPSEVTSFGNTSVVDCISHTILSALAATQHGRSWVRVDFLLQCLSDNVTSLAID